MFHMELFTSSIASGTTTPQQVTYFTPDNILPKQVNGVQISPDLPFLMAVMGVGANLATVRIQMASFLPFPYINLSPNNRGTAFESPPRIWDFSAHPIPLKPTEELDIFATQNLGTPQTEFVACLFSDAKPNPLGVSLNPAKLTSIASDPGRFFTAHWTFGTALTAGQWSIVQPSFDFPLYAGTYALVGARVMSATALFFRMFPAQGPKWRPGGIAVQNYDQIDAYNQRLFSPYGTTPAGWAVWLTFYQNVPPQVEIFATAADPSGEGWFDLVYLGPSVAPSI